ncbi:hypothetical protein [Nitrolancea hollandica]|uniref:Uncharacterized protein n=1 Tax=Nitrolancea hollandica Lb TaxID=1129897 RepID=I4EIW9_9BACT|nr:hypothetical protein [Nitrolancea hollandica]CCF84631.1 conserved hypothetical protein [Nitrolancea hollandica Lb]
MAGGPLNQEFLVGVRIPGAGRLRFRGTAIEDIALRDWVAVPSPAGEEPGQVVVAPQQFKLAKLPERLPAVIRRLTPDEVELVATRVERAREVLDAVIATVRERRFPLFITGLRFTLGGEAVIVSFRGPQGAGEGELPRMVEPVAGVPVHLEHEAAGTNLFGSLGRPPAALTFNELLRDRFPGTGRDLALAPEGLVRLGTRVRTDHGAGSVISVATRERRARVRLDSGEEVLVPVDDLSVAG